MARWISLLGPFLLTSMVLVGPAAATGSWTCAQIDACIMECDQSDWDCGQACYDNGSAAAQSQYDALEQCGWQNCYQAQTEDEWMACMGSSCQQELEACLGDGGSQTGSLSCAEVDECMYSNCEQDDYDCYDACYYDGTAEAQAQIDALYDCYFANCPNAQTAEEYWECMEASCTASVEACYGEQQDQTGDWDCAQVDECMYACNQNDYDCYDACYTNGTAQAQSQIDQLYACSDSHCSQAQTEQEWLDCMQAACLEALEICLGDICTDQDNDGYCQPQDCNDYNPGIHPGAQELCNDSLDNNCNGQVDENCGDCSDLDEDGYCTPVDCNDSHPQVNPGVAESCGDLLDNNCSGQVDEGCSGGSCTSNQDCNDYNPCTLDTCIAGQGCQLSVLPDGTACGDGLACQAGVCAAQAQDTEIDNGCHTGGGKASVLGLGWLVGLFGFRSRRRRG